MRRFVLAKNDMSVTHSANLILDGGMATQLESRGHSLNDALWSARLLCDAPDEIAAVHRDFLEAGADIVTSASYQATIAAFTQTMLDRTAAIDLIQRSVELAIRERDAFLEENSSDKVFSPECISLLSAPSWFDREGRLKRPLVAASVGPYGAFLANGSEYTGDYDLDEAGLIEFHRERWHLFLECGPDLMLCETIPSITEAYALAKVAAETPEIPTWISFGCRDALHLNDGTPIAKCASFLNSQTHIKAIGVNCTAPQHVSGLIDSIRSTSQKAILVYPNSGEVYDACSKTWSGERDATDFAIAAVEWQQHGANIIGGCCRTGPGHIRALSNNSHRASA